MYRTSTGYSPIVKALSGELNSSTIMLRLDDIYCSILVCEISFHLHRWKELGQHLGMAKEEVDVVSCNNEQSTYFHEPAFQLLATWLQQSTEPPTLERLVNGLGLIGIKLQLSTWTNSFYSITRSLNTILTLHLAERIQRHWKFIARLLGESETSIHATIKYEEGSTVLAQASHMVEQLKKRTVDGLPQTEELRQTALTTQKVFTSLHCVSEHLYDQCLDNALTLFM